MVRINLWQVNKPLCDLGSSPFMWEWWWLLTQEVFSVFDELVVAEYLVTGIG